MKNNRTLTQEQIEKIRARLRALPNDKRSDLLAELTGSMGNVSLSHDADKRAHASFFFRSIEMLLDFD